MTKEDCQVSGMKIYIIVCLLCLDKKRLFCQRFSECALKGRQLSESKLRLMRASLNMNDRTIECGKNSSSEKWSLLK